MDVCRREIKMDRVDLAWGVIKGDESEDDENDGMGRSEEFGVDVCLWCHPTEVRAKHL